LAPRQLSPEDLLPATRFRMHRGPGLRRDARDDLTPLQPESPGATEPMTIDRRALVIAVVAAAATAVGALQWWRTHNVGPVQRGARLAVQRGCLSCHGAPGRLSDPDGARGIGGVPSFDHDDVTSYAKTADEIREWILDGQPRRLRDQPADEPPPVLRMPAWRDRLPSGDVDALVTWIRAISDFDAVPTRIASARETIARLGCFTCHGPQGRGDTPNPGSLKGYIPAWSGADFPELVRDDGEIRDWVKDGGPRRLRDNPAAAFFMRRQLVRMPAFGAKVTDDEIRAITEYIRWLRGGPAAGGGQRSTAAARDR
jgi:mono/diheme cytochrome c family protein